MEEACDSLLQSEREQLEQCILLDMISTSTTVYEPETIRVTHPIHRNGHPGLSTLGSRHTLNSDMDTKYSHYTSIDLSLFGSEDLFKIYSDSQQQKDRLLELYD